MIWPDDVSFEGYSQKKAEWFNDPNHFLGDPPNTDTRRFRGPPRFDMGLSRIPSEERGEVKMDYASNSTNVLKQSIDLVKYWICCPWCDLEKCAKDTPDCEAEQWAKAKLVDPKEKGVELHAD